MNADALKFLHTNNATALADAQSHAPANTLLHPENVELVDLQRFQPYKRRFTGQMETADLADFVKYTLDNANRASQGFIDADRLSCRVIFDLGDTEFPGHAGWTATLALKQTAAFAALLAIDGIRETQLGLTNWLEDWAVYLVPWKSGTENYESYGALSKAISAIRKITIKATSESESEARDFGATRTALEEVEASSKLELPGGFYFRCEPYLGLPSREFRLRLLVITGGKEPVVALRIVQLEEAKEAIAKDFKTVVGAQLGESMTLTIGKFTP